MSEGVPGYDPRESTTFQMDVHLAKVSPSEGRQRKEGPKDANPAGESRETLIQESPDKRYEGEGWTDGGTYGTDVDQPVESRTKTDFREIAENIAKELELPEPQPLTFRERVAANTMKVLIRTRLLRHQPITEATFHSSKVFAMEKLPRFPDATEPPAGREGDSTWGAGYATRVLNSNENVFGLAPQEFEEHRAATRFNVLVPVEKNSDGQDMQQVIYDVFRDSETSMPWVNGTDVEHSYKLGVKSKEDVVVFDARGGWANIDPAQYRNKVVYIRTGESQGTMTEDEQRVMRQLLDGNKMVIREINDPTQGNLLEAVANHNWIDAVALKRGLNQIGEPMGGYREVTDTSTLRSIMEGSANRYNALHPEAKTRMRNIVLDEAQVQQIEQEYQEFVNAMPDKNRLAEIFGDGDNQEALAWDLQGKLTDGKFMQLLIQQAAGVDGKKVNGSVLQFKSDTHQELDQFQTYGGLSDIRRHLDVINDPNSSRRDARHSVMEISRILDFYSEDRSNVTGKIGAAIEQLPGEKTKIELAYATIRSGAARGNAGQVMTSYSEVYGQFKTVYYDSQKHKVVQPDMYIGGFASSAHPTFMDQSFSIMADRESGRTKRYIISVKY